MGEDVFSSRVKACSCQVDEDQACEVLRGSCVGGVQTGDYWGHGLAGALEAEGRQKLWEALENMPQMTTLLLVSVRAVVEGDRGDW